MGGVGGKRLPGPPALGAAGRSPPAVADGFVALLFRRVTQNLPARCQLLSPSECFRTFVRAIFYVGKGTRGRPYRHLYEALTHHQGGQGGPARQVGSPRQLWGQPGGGLWSLGLLRYARSFQIQGQSSFDHRGLTFDRLVWQKPLAA